MSVFPTRVAELFEGVVLSKAERHIDGRGNFTILSRAGDLPGYSAQDCYSVSRLNVIRGMHYQNDPPLGKFITIVQGEVIDHLIDLRDGPTKHRTLKMVLGVGSQLYVPAGIAHGFRSVFSNTIVHYRFDNCHSPETEMCIHPFNQFYDLDWEILQKDANMSDKDKNGDTSTPIPYFLPGGY